MSESCKAIAELGYVEHVEILFAETQLVRNDNAILLSDEVIRFAYEILKGRLGCISFCIQAVRQLQHTNDHLDDVSVDHCTHY